MLKYVDRVGVELEGGYRTTTEPLALRRRMTKPLRGLVKVAYDGSINVHAGREVKVGPFYPHQRRRWRRVCRVMWPRQADRSCGMHVHVSFKTPAHYALLKQRHRELWAALERVLRKYQREVPYLEERLNGSNYFCRRPVLPEYQQAMGVRYYALNWLAWEKFRTLEVRVLPQTQDKEMGIKLIEAVVRTVDRVIDRYQGDMV